MLLLEILINIQTIKKQVLKMSTIKNISVYIPHIFANFSKSYVADVFENLKIAKVKDIDFISKMGQDGKPFNAAYIHFEYWFDNIIASNFQERVLNKSPAKLMYDDPWFWLVLENKGRKFVTGERKQRIDIGDLKQVIVNPDKAISTKETSDQRSLNLKNDFDLMDEMMAEFEADYEETDQYLISIDGRYVEEIERENIELRMQMAKFQNAYYAETIKSQGLAQALQIINNK